MNVYEVIASVGDTEIFRDDFYAATAESAKYQAYQVIYENDPYHNPYLADSDITYKVIFLYRED